jgi:hypothetical protein
MMVDVVEHVRPPALSPCVPFAFVTHAFASYVCA